MSGYIIYLHASVLIKLKIMMISKSQGDQTLHYRFCYKTIGAILFVNVFTYSIFFFCENY